MHHRKYWLAPWISPFELVPDPGLHVRVRYQRHDTAVDDTAIVTGFWNGECFMRASPINGPADLRPIERVIAWRFQR